MLWAVAIALAASPALAAEPPAAAPPAAAKPTAKPWGKLVSLDGKQTYQLELAEVAIGSGDGNGVTLRDPSVSPQHAKLTYNGGLVDLHDLGSKTGTLAAGALVKKGKPFRILQPMDLAFGAVILRFEFGERPALLPPTQAPPKGKVGGKVGGKAPKNPKKTEK